MVRRRQRERSVWEVVLPDADKLWPAGLRRIDQLIDDEALVEIIAVALERRWAQSRRPGRPGTPAEVVLRMLVFEASLSLELRDARARGASESGLSRLRADQLRRGTRCEDAPEDHAGAGAGRAYQSGSGRFARPLTLSAMISTRGCRTARHCDRKVGILPTGAVR